jgi:hypothetical protein
MARNGAPLRAAAATVSLTGAAFALAACGTAVSPAAQHSSARPSGSSRSAAGSGSAGPAVNASGSPVASGGALCAGPGAVTQVRIAQSLLAHPIRPGAVNLPASPSPVPGPTGRPAPGLFLMRTVTAPGKARALARAVCGLPALGDRPVPCPMVIANGGSYQLSFTADGRTLPSVVVQDTGCETVTGAGAVRRAAGQPAFWTLLRKLAGPPLALPGRLPPGPGGGGVVGGPCMRPQGGAPPKRAIICREPVTRIPPPRPPT